MPRSDRLEATSARTLTLVGGVMLAMAVSGVLWSGVVVGMHIAGAF